MRVLEVVSDPAWVKETVGPATIYRVPPKT
jgi:hypothetical protein